MLHRRLVRTDASALTKSACELEFKRTCVEGLREISTFNDTNYGTAFHKFLSTMAESGGDFQLAVQKASTIVRRPVKIRPKKEHLTEKHLLKTCFDYWESVSQQESDLSYMIDDNATCCYCNGMPVQQDENGNEVICSHCVNGHRSQPMVEIQFDIPVVITDAIQVNVAGTIDRLVKINNGCWCVRDYKTTSAWNIDKYFIPYRLSPQLKLYIWALKRLAWMYPTGPLKGLDTQVIGAAIDGVFLKSQSETIFKSSEVYQPKHSEMEQFEELLLIKCKELAELAFREPIPMGMIEGTCSSGKFPCKFFNVCSAPDKIAAAHVLKNNFKVVTYNPLTHGQDNFPLEIE